MPLCWIGGWNFLGTIFWELLMLCKLGSWWNRKILVTKAGHWWSDSKEVFPLMKGEVGVYVLTHYQGHCCFSLAHFVQRPPIPFITKDPDSSEASAGCLFPTDLMATWHPPVPLRWGLHSPGSEFTLPQWNSISCFHQRPLLSGGTQPHIGINHLMKIWATPFWPPYFFPIEGAESERERLCKDSSDHPAGHDTCLGHQAFSNYPVVLLWHGWKHKTHYRSKRKRKEALVWGKNYVMGMSEQTCIPSWLSLKSWNLTACKPVSLPFC